MKCFYCGRETNAGNGWHPNCVKRFFNREKLPEAEWTAEALEELAQESTTKGYTVAGVQKKLSLGLSDQANPRLTIVGYQTGYILKPQVEEYPCLPEAEYLVMQMARASGIATVPFAMIYINMPGRELAYITKRIDRIFSAGEGMKMLAMEDFCQLDGRLTQDKYRGSYERCAAIIRKYSSRPGLDLSELYMRLVFSFLVGNSDMHLKNFSLIETMPGSDTYILSPAYDLLPVNLVMPQDQEELALSLNGKKRNIRRKDFYIFADGCGIAKASAEKMMGKLVSMEEKYLTMCAESYLPEEMKDRFSRLIRERCSRL